MSMKYIDWRFTKVVNGPPLEGETPLLEYDRGNFKYVGPDFDVIRSMEDRILSCYQTMNACAFMRVVAGTSWRALYVDKVGVLIYPIDSATRDELDQMRWCGPDSDNVPPGFNIMDKGFILSVVHKWDRSMAGNPYFFYIRGVEGSSEAPLLGKRLDMFGMHIDFRDLPMVEREKDLERRELEVAQVSDELKAARAYLFNTGKA